MDIQVNAMDVNEKLKAIIAEQAGQIAVLQVALDMAQKKEEAPTDAEHVS